MPYWALVGVLACDSSFPEAGGTRWRLRFTSLESQLSWVDVWSVVVSSLLSEPKSFPGGLEVTFRLSRFFFLRFCGSFDTEKSRFGGVRSGNARILESYV